MDDFTRRELAAIDALFKSGDYTREDVDREKQSLRSIRHEDTPDYRQELIDAGRGHLLK